MNRRPVNRRTALKRAGALAVALGALEASGLSPSPHSAPVLPSSLRTSSFDISAFLAVPPQDYRTGVGFADQQVNGAGPARICTFAGTGAARLTTAAQGDYFDNGSIQHLSHVIPDMLQFFDMDDEMEPPGEDGISASGRSPPRSRLLPRCPIC
jgi:hypothetical protein